VDRAGMVRGEVVGYYVEEDRECVEGLTGQCQSLLRAKRLTIRSRMLKRTQGERSQEVSKR